MQKTGHIKVLNSRRSSDRPRQPSTHRPIAIPCEHVPRRRGGGLLAKINGLKRSTLIADEREATPARAAVVHVDHADTEDGADDLDVRSCQRFQRGHRCGKSSGASGEKTGEEKAWSQRREGLAASAAEPPDWSSIAPIRVHRSFSLATAPRVGLWSARRLEVGVKGREARRVFASALRTFILEVLEWEFRTQPINALRGLRQM